MFAITSASSGCDTRVEPASSRFATPLPRALRASADALDWHDFCAHHTAAGPLRLGTWSTTAAHDDLVDVCATFAVGDRICAVRATALGPLGAATSMLHSLGFAVEITGMHLQSVGVDTVAFVECDVDGRRAWGMGIDPEAADAGVSAMIAAVNRTR